MNFINKSVFMAFVTARGGGSYVNKLFSRITRAPFRTRDIVPKVRFNFEQDCNWPGVSGPKQMDLKVISFSVSLVSAPSAPATFPVKIKLEEFST